VLFGSNGGSYTVCTVSDMWVYTDVVHIIQTRVGKTNWDSSVCRVSRKSFRLPFWARVPQVPQPRYRKKKKVKHFVYVSHCNNLTTLTTSPMPLETDIPHRLSLQSAHKRRQNMIYACQVSCDLPPHGTHNCVSASTLRKIPEERRSSTLTNNSRLMVSWVKNRLRASLQLGRL
jgi:hypothetical protein